MSPDNVLAAQMWSWPDAVIKRDGNGVVMFVNAAFLGLYGGRVEDWQGMGLSGWNPPPSPGQVVRFETRLPGLQAERVFDWIEAADTQTGTALAVARDVTALTPVASPVPPFAAPPPADSPPPADAPPPFVPPHAPSSHTPPFQAPFSEASYAADLPANAPVIPSVESAGPGPDAAAPFADPTDFGSESTAPRLAQPGTGLATAGPMGMPAPPLGMDEDAPVIKVSRPGAKTVPDSQDAAPQSSAPYSTPQSSLESASVGLGGGSGSSGGAFGLGAAELAHVSPLAGDAAPVLPDAAPPTLPAVDMQPHAPEVMAQAAPAPGFETYDPSLQAPSTHVHASEDGHAVVPPPFPPLPGSPPAPSAEAPTPREREFARRTLPIESGDSVLGDNWRDAVIAKAVGGETPAPETPSHEAPSHEMLAIEAPASETPPHAHGGAPARVAPAVVASAGVAPAPAHAVDHAAPPAVSAAALAPTAPGSAAPQAVAPEAAATEPTATEPALAAEGVRILLAEDNAINALLTRTLLEAEGCTVDTVEDGALAVEAMKLNHYDLIFMDMRMPNMDGLEATRAIRRLDHRSKGLPIIALTANAFDDDRNACFDAGMNDFMTKPVSAEELSEMVARWLEDKRTALAS